MAFENEGGNSREVFFHVGLPKTATTYLQRKFFPLLKGIHFTKKRHFELYDHIIKTTDSDRFLFSCEYDRRMEPVLKGISEKYPGAKIIVAFRRQDKWIKSKYKYYLRKSGTKTFSEFFDLEKDKGHMKKQDLFFMNYVHLIERYFKYPPLVIFQDELKKKPYVVFDRICRFIGASYEKDDIKITTVKKAYDNKQLYVVRGFNKIVKHNANFFKKGLMRTLHRKSHDFFLHLTAAIAGFIPDKLIPSESLIPKRELENIKNFYSEDWEKCYEYAYGKKVERFLDARDSYQDQRSAARA